MTKQVEFEVVPKVQKGAIASIKSTIGDTLKTGFGANSTLRGAAFSGDVGGAASKASDALGKVFKSIVDFTGGLVALTAVNKLEDTLRPLTEIVSKANPALAEQVGEAFEDMRAVIGESLTPVLQAFMPLIRQLGDFIANIVPSQGEMNNLMQAFQPILDSLSETMKTITPITRFMTSSFGIMGTVIRIAAEVVEFFVSIINSFIKALVSAVVWIGKIIQKLPGGGKIGGALAGLDKPTDQTARGRAIHAASYHSIESLGHNLAQAAFSQGGQKKPEEETAEATKETVGIARGILNWLSKETASALTGNFG